MRRILLAILLVLLVTWQVQARISRMPNQKPIHGSQIEWTHPLAPDIMCLLMNEGTGNIVNDIVNGYNGTIVKARWHDGALNFLTANSSYIDFGTVPFDIGKGDYTIFVRFKGLQADTNALFSFENNSPTVYAEYLTNYAIGMYSEEDVDLQPGGAAFIWDDLLWINNVWSNVMFVRQNTEIFMYKDGRKSTQSVQYDNLTSIDTIKFNIGRRILDNDRYFTGDIDGFYIYGRALTSVDAEDLHEDRYCFIKKPQNMALRWFGGTAAPPAAAPTIPAQVIIISITWLDCETYALGVMYG